MSTRTGLIVALDDPDLAVAESLAKSLADHVSALKVGLTLFGAHGPEAILAIGQHAPVFCDLKLHDIPHQVAGVAAELTRQGVWMFTVHASGGAEMVRAAVQATEGSAHPPLVAGVTVLTSISSETLDLVGQGNDPSSQVRRLAEVAVDAGATALVCSPNEVTDLRERFGGSIKLIVPGIRSAGSAHGDQARVMTPAQAAAAGADHIVVGRPITQSEDPVGVAERILGELAG